MVVGIDVKRKDDRSLQGAGVFLGKDDGEGHDDSDEDSGDEGRNQRPEPLRLAPALGRHGFEVHTWGGRNKSIGEGKKRGEQVDWNSKLCHVVEHALEMVVESETAARKKPGHTTLPCYTVLFFLFRIAQRILSMSGLAIKQRHNLASPSSRAVRSVPQKYNGKRVGMWVVLLERTMKETRDFLKEILPRKIS